MSKQLEKPRLTRRVPAPMAAAPRWRGQWLTGLAFAVAVVVVVTRVLMGESIRTPIIVSPGGSDAPASPGPASGLLLDLLACVCPLLVLLRRCVDPDFTLRRAKSPLIFAALGAWALVSVFWSDDKFAAAVSACHLFAAAVVFWAIAQSVSGWKYVWWIAGLSAGLLAALLTHGLWYQLVDRQELIEQFNRDPDFVLKIQNVQRGTFAYTQLENSILKGELRGFSHSPNTYAAQLTLLGLITLGAMAACIRSGRWVGAAAAGLLVIVDLPVLRLTQSRTGMITAGAGGMIIFAYIAIGAAGPHAAALVGLLRRWRLMYVLGAAAVLAAGAFVVGYGLSRGTLFHDSLNFRWRYWTASFELWSQHRWIGVGWENFGSHYLGVRAPEATEEIKDPHNYLVRFASELGLIGLVLALCWTAWAWWEMAHPAAIAPLDQERPHAEPARSTVLISLALPLVAGVLLNVICAVDLLNDNGSYVLLEAIRRGVLLVVLLFGAGAISIRGLISKRETDAAFEPASRPAASNVGIKQPTLDYSRSARQRRGGGELTLAADTSPAPWILVSLVVGLGMFFVHSLIDFAMFEVGPLFLFALLLGAAVGLHTPPAAVEAVPGRRRGAKITLSLGGALWLLAAVALVLPVVSAESIARAADDSLRKNQPAIAAGGYAAAFGATVRNADYAERAGAAWHWAGDTAACKAWLDAAIAADPSAAAIHVSRAELLASLEPPDIAGAVADLAEAVRLDPINRSDRLRYGQLLEKARQPRAALYQYAKAFELNDRLTPEERRRFTADEVRGIPEAIARLIPKIAIP